MLATRGRVSVFTDRKVAQACSTARSPSISRISLPGTSNRVAKIPRATANSVAEKTISPLISNPNERAIAPSVAKADPLNLETELAAAIEGGATWLHCSVQDGRMTKKLGSMGPGLVGALRKKFPDITLDVKYTGLEPEARIAEFAAAGADNISVHPEATPQLAGVLAGIKASGASAGVIMNPATPVETIAAAMELGLVDIVVVMLVSPGMGGPKDVDGACRRTRAVLEKWSTMEGIPRPCIQVDGGIDGNSAPKLLAAGANVMVVGGALFKPGADKREVIEGYINSI